MPKHPETITFTVQSSKYGEFPLDMLRRDNCTPATPEDTAMIGRLGLLSDKSDLPKIIQVKLVAPWYPGRPTVARWNSFGYSVIECSNPTVLLEPQTPHPDDLRGKLMVKVAKAVVRLRGHSHMAESVYDVVRYAVDVGARAPAERQEALGACQGALFVLGSGHVAGLIDLTDVTLLIETLEFVRDALCTEGPAMRSLYTGDEPTLLIGKLEAMARRLNAPDQT
jgi:hypothetical protein